MILGYHKYKFDYNLFNSKKENCKASIYQGYLSDASSENETSSFQEEGNGGE